MAKSTEKTTNDLTLRKDFVRCWVHAHPSYTADDASALYDRMVKQFPNMTRGGHRGLVGRMKPWETVEHECPCCGKTVHGIEAVKEGFGLRRYRGRVYVQSWCRKCRANKGEGNGNRRINPEVDDKFTNGPESCL